LLLLILIVPKGVLSQWAVNGSHIYNTNTGNVGIGNNAPASLLYVGKSMTEPTITVRNLGGSGGATYSMVDNVSGANWKFKATNSGGFKIRDNAFGLDVFQIEANSAANVIYISAAGSLGVGTGTPEATAVADLSSTSRGFLPPRMTQAQLSAIPAPANGLLVFNTTDEKFYIYVELVNAWKEILYGSGTISGAFTCGNPLIKNHEAGTVAPVSKTVTYGTVTNVPGETSICWITRNLGADQQATAVNDNTEASAGWYWQFNRMQGFKHDGTTRTPNTSWIDNIFENTDWTAGNDPCTLLLGAGWRLPTANEWTNVDASGGWENWNGAYGSLLKLHAAGNLNNTNGSLQFRRSDGYLWSSLQSYQGGGNDLYLGSGSCHVYDMGKAYGVPVRCVKD
ncbi:MAG: hypothetical protein RBS55_08500, partial [Bacteroidales bacterium]|nr:hypothetical protein [Bacteroidales bacterium]